MTWSYLKPKPKTGFRLPKTENPVSGKGMHPLWQSLVAWGNAFVSQLAFLNPVLTNSRHKRSYLLIDAVLNAERLSQRRVNPNILVVTEGDRLRVTADGEPWIRVANVR